MGTTNKATTEVICIIDRSGSMHDIIHEAVDAVNEFIEAQAKVKGKAKLTLVSFDDTTEVIYDRVNIKKAPKLHVDQVRPRSSTSLLDAIGYTINRAQNNKHTICIIQTDGYENSSVEYSYADIERLIANKQQEGWEFLFIGSGINPQAMADKLSIKKTLSVSKTRDGMALYSSAISAAATEYRTNG